MKNRYWFDVNRQADCEKSLPNNTDTEGYIIVTTPGSKAKIGDLLHDDGTAFGKMEIIPAKKNRCILVSPKIEKYMRIWAKATDKAESEAKKNE